MPANEVTKPPVKRMRDERDELEAQRSDSSDRDAPARSRGATRSVFEPDGRLQPSQDRDKRAIAARTIGTRPKNSSPSGFGYACMTSPQSRSASGAVK